MSRLSITGFLDRAKHRWSLKLDRLRGIIRKIDLKTILFDEEKRIVIDQNLPELKQDHPSCHEITHRVIPWHKAYYFGDTAQTLDPEWQESLEEEATFLFRALVVFSYYQTTKPHFEVRAADVAPMNVGLSTKESSL